VVACTRDHPLCATRKLKPAVLTEFEYLSREPGSGCRAAIEAHFVAQGVAPSALKTQMELGSPAALLGVVATGLGFAIVPRTGVESGAGDLAVLPLAPPLFTDITLIAPQDRYEIRLAAIFRQFARERLGDLAA
jgi:DNA-binding transcriptional LysR family regulator